LKVAVTDLAFGVIVEAPVADPRGNVKPHPVVILIDKAEILLDQPVPGVVISSSIPNPLPAKCIAVPWSRDGHPYTGLNRRCAAVCDWLVTVPPSEMLFIRGKLPDRYLLEILAKVRELNPEPSTDDEPEDDDPRFNPGECPPLSAQGEEIKAKLEAAGHAIRIGMAGKMWLATSRIAPDTSLFAYGRTDLDALSALALRCRVDLRGG
jgi:hypothetical protein